MANKIGKTLVVRRASRCFAGCGLLGMDDFEAHIKFEKVFTPLTWHESI